jgi:hypothetical protein
MFLHHEWDMGKQYPTLIYICRIETDSLKNEHQET